MCPQKEVGAPVAEPNKESPSHVLGKVGVFALREDEKVVHFALVSPAFALPFGQNTVEQVLKDTGDVNRLLH